MRRAMVWVWLVAIGPATVRAAEVSGRVEMPATCAPEVSPAVVVLEPIGGTRPPALPEPASVTLINQRGLQFVPRVAAMTLGQPLRFANADSETHNVHILATGTNFNQSVQ